MQTSQGNELEMIIAEPVDDLVERLREVITRGCDYSTGVADHAAWCSRIHYLAGEAAARIEELEAIVSEYAEIIGDPVRMAQMKTYAEDCAAFQAGVKAERAASKGTT